MPSRARSPFAAAAALAVGLGVLVAPAASASPFTCSSIKGNLSTHAYIKDYNGACGTVGAWHKYTPTPGIVATTGWYYDGDYARTPHLPTLITPDWRTNA